MIFLEAFRIFSLYLKFRMYLQVDHDRLITLYTCRTLSICKFWFCFIFGEFSWIIVLNFSHALFYFSCLESPIINKFFLLFLSSVSVTFSLTLFILFLYIILYFSLSNFLYSIPFKFPFVIFFSYISYSLHFTISFLFSVHSTLFISFWSFT